MLWAQCRSTRHVVLLSILCSCLCHATCKQRHGLRLSATPAASRAAPPFAVVFHPARARHLLGLLVRGPQTGQLQQAAGAPHHRHGRHDGDRRAADPKQPPRALLDLIRVAHHTDLYTRSWSSPRSAHVDTLRLRCRCCPSPLRSASASSGHNFSGDCGHPHPAEEAAGGGGPRCAPVYMQNSFSLQTPPLLFILFSTSVHHCRGFLRYPAGLDPRP